MYNLIDKGILTPKDPTLKQCIWEDFLVNKWQPEETRIKLKHVKDDQLAFSKLFSATDEHIKESNLTLQFDSSELEHDLAAVFYKHRIPKAEKGAKKIIEELGKRGQGRGKVQSFEERVYQLFEKYSCSPPASMDLQQRNDIIHEGSLKIEDTGESLKLMTRLFNSVTKLLFKILQYDGSIDIFPEDDWQVTHN